MAMSESQFEQAVNRPGAFQAFEYTVVDTPNRDWRGKVTLTRKVRMRGKTGVAYANLARNADREVGPRPWGVRRNRYFVDHTPRTGPRAGQPTVYATLIPIEGSFRTTYFVDGQEVSRERYNGFRTAGAAKPKPFQEYMDIALDTLTAVI